MTSTDNHNANEHEEDQVPSIPAVAGEAGKWLSLEFLQSVPEEDIWLAGQFSPHTRSAYKRDVADFVRTMGIRSVSPLK